MERWNRAYPWLDTEVRHDVAGEPGQLLLEFGEGRALCPVQHDVVEAGIGGLPLAQMLHDLRRRAEQPGLLVDAVAQGGQPGGGAGRAPGAALGVGVAHEAERREPLVALVVGWLDAPEGLL